MAVSAAYGTEMREGHARIAVAIGLLLLLSGLLLWGTAVAARRLREREEARHWVTVALAEHNQERATKLFRQARSFDAAYGACQEGRRLEKQGRFAAAAESFRVCRDADPALPAAHLAWAEAVLHSQSKVVYPELRTHLLSLLETRQGSAADPETLHSIESLVLDLEELMATEAPPEHSEPWTVEDLVEVLTRSHSRGTSRYDGPRVPLRLGFRPGDATLDGAAEAQLRDVARALRIGRLANAILEIEGHTDSAEAPTEVERTALGLRRAGAVRDFLVRSGISRGRLRVTSLGGRYPLASNESLSGRDANRRVELFNLDEGSPVWRDVREGPPP
jgi:outer membrane protein OmpA-like peptidoglycan-associated protein